MAQTFQNIQSVKYNHFEPLQGMSDPPALAVKSALSIYGRLFDHRPLIQGEARFFIEEFQNKRKGADTVKLEQCKVGLDNLCNEVSSWFNTCTADRIIPWNYSHFLRWSGYYYFVLLI